MPTPLEVLILEDRPDDVRLVLNALRQDGFSPHWKNVKTAETYLRHLDEDLDVILAGYNLPQFSGLDALHRLQERGLDIPFIIVTSSFEEGAIECMRQGADDYLRKDRLGRLGEAVRHALHARKLRQEKQAAEQALRESEERFRHLAENAPDVIYRFKYRPVPHLEYISPAVAEVTGYSPEDFFADPNLFSRLFQEEDGKKVRMSLQKGKVGQSLISRLWHKNGDLKWLERRGTATYEGGNLVSIEGIVRDVTARIQAERQVRVSEALYRGLVEASPDGIARVDVDGKIILANQHAAKMLGYEEVDDLVGQNLRDFVAPADYPHLMENWRRALRQGQIENVEFGMVRRDGSRFPAEVNASLVRDPAGEPQAVISTLRDISARKQTAQVLQQRNDEIRYLYRAGTELARTLDLETLAETTVDIVSGMMDCATLVISHYEPDEQRIHCLYVQHEGQRHDVSQFPPIPLEAEGQGTQSRVIHTGESLLLNDYLAAIRDTETVFFFDDEGIASEEIKEEDVSRSALVVPLKLGNQVQGVLQVFSPEKDAYTLDHLAFLEALAPQIGAAISNALLHKQTEQELSERRRAEQAEREQRALAEALVGTATTLTQSLDLDEVLKQILATLGNVVPHDAADILLVEDDIARCIGYHGHEQFGTEHIIATLEFRVSDTPVNRRMAETGQPLVVPDTQKNEAWNRFSGLEWIRSFAGTPIQLDGNLIGFISLTNATPNSFTQADAERLHAFANQVAIAIRNARLYEAERQQRVLAEALADTATLISRTLNLDEVMERILDYVGRVVPNDGANISLIEAGIGRVVGCRGRYVEEGIVEEVLKLRFPIADTPNLQRMIDTQAPVVIPTTHEYQGWQTLDATAWVRSYMAAPIIQDGTVIGFLNLDSATPNFFTETHAQRLQTFADQVAVALRNAQLYEAEQRRRRAAETLRKASAVLNATLESELVMARILEQLSNAIPFDSASIQRREEDHLVVSAAVGFSRPGAVVGQTIPINSHIPNAQVIDRSAPYAVTDVTTTHPAFMEYAEEPQVMATRSWLGVPLVANERTIGIITLDRYEVDPFTEEEVNLAVTFANHAAIALENARLYQALEHYSESLEQAVAERTASLQEATEQLEVMLSNSPDAILLLHRDGSIDTFNPAVETLFGYKGHEVLDQSPSFLIANRDRQAFKSALQAAIAGEEQRLNLVGARHNASTFDADVVLAPIRKEGRVVSILCTLHDISKLKEVERMKDAFVSNVSHELRTPITSLKLYHGLLKMNPDKKTEYMARLEREINRLNVIVEDLLRLSRLDQGQVFLKLVAVDLNDMATSFADDRRLLAEQNGLTIEVEVAPNVAPAWADAGLLHQVVSILLSNATSYTPAGGHITLRTHPGRDGEAGIVGISVSDTGPGIHPEDVDHIFERFFRGKVGRNSGAPGTGLGLSIAREIVSRHEGDMVVNSRTGANSGTTFTVWLPAADG